MTKEYNPDHVVNINIEVNSRWDLLERGVETICKYLKTDDVIATINILGEQHNLEFNRREIENNKGELDLDSYIYLKLLDFNNEVEDRLGITEKKGKIEK
jgi:hypothetical protein